MSETYKTKKQLVEELAKAHRIIARSKELESERKQAEEALQKSYDHFRICIEHAPVAIAMVDDKMRYIAVSRRLLSDYGLEGQDIIGKTHYEVFPENRQKWKEIHESVLAGKPRKCEEDAFPRLDGSLDWVRWEALPWYEQTGEIGGLIMFTEVITERKQAGTALQEASEYAENLIETANAMVVGLDLKGNVRVFNKAAEDITGYTREEVQTRNWFELIVPRHHYPHVWSEFERLGSGELPRNFENPIRTKTGEERYIMWQNSEIREHGQVTGTVSFGIDITERKQAEQATLRANERLQMAQLAASEGVWDWDIRTGEIEWDPALFHLFGLDPRKDKASFETWEAVLHPDDRENAALRTDKALKDHTLLVNEYRVIHPDGKICWISALGRGLYDVQGRPLRMIGICLDITGRKQSEEELARHRSHLEELVKERTAEIEARNAQLEQQISERIKAEKALRDSSEEILDLYNNAPCGYHSLDKDGFFIRINDTELKWLGYFREEIIGTMKATDIMTSSSARTFMLTFPSFKESGRLENLEVEFIRKDGSILQASLSATAVKDKNGAFVMSRSIVFDITERKRVEEEKKRLEDQLMQNRRLEAIGKFAGGIAHDLNNILYPIVINAELLMGDSQEDSDQHQMLQEVVQAAYRQRDLVKQILSFSRQSEQKLIPVKVMPLLKEAFNFARSSLPSTIEIKQNIDVYSDVVMGDPTQIHQIIMNLIRNAADSFQSLQGTIEVGLSNVHVASDQETKEGEYLELTVRDTGCGISKEVKEQIFNPFFTTKEVGKGTGMGLSFAHGILKSHGGTISVESEPGKGSKFTVHIPLLEEKPGQQSRHPQNTQQGLSATSSVKMKRLHGNKRVPS